MPAAFEVHHALLSDYAALTDGGKSVVGGLYGSDIRFPFLPEMMPQLFCLCTLRPLSMTGTPIIRLIGPKGDTIFHLHARFDISEEPPAFATINLVLQLPAIPFPGAGEYRISVFDGAEPAYEKRFWMNIGVSADPKVEITPVKAGLGSDA